MRGDSSPKLTRGEKNRKPSAESFGFDDVKDSSGLADILLQRRGELAARAGELGGLDMMRAYSDLTDALIHRVFDQAVEESRKILASHKVNISVEDDGGGPDRDKPAWFDPHLLGRVLRHLLENVASYTPPGSRVTLSSKRAGDRLEFLVEDNGPGIDAQDLPLIFEKFYRGKRSAGARKGSGMGLAINRAILNAHGGGIEASSAPGSGARFRFWVPLVEKEPSRNR